MKFGNYLDMIQRLADFYGRISSNKQWKSPRLCSVPITILVKFDNIFVAGLWKDVSIGRILVRTILVSELEVFMYLGDSHRYLMGTLNENVNVLIS